ncbi:jg24192, partial [Pararge aegeria aegeria]
MMRMRAHLAANRIVAHQAARVAPRALVGRRVENESVNGDIVIRNQSVLDAQTIGLANCSRKWVNFVIYLLIVLI